MWAVWVQPSSGSGRALAGDRLTFAVSSGRVTLSAMQAAPAPAKNSHGRLVRSAVSLPIAAPLAGLGARSSWELGPMGPPVALLAPHAGDAFERGRRGMGQGCTTVPQCVCVRRRRGEEIDCGACIVRCTLLGYALLPSGGLAVGTQEAAIRECLP